MSKDVNVSLGFNFGKVKTKNLQNSHDRAPLRHLFLDSSGAKEILSLTEGYFFGDTEKVLPQIKRRT